MRLLIAQYFGACQIACLLIMPSPASHCFRIRFAYVQLGLMYYRLSRAIWLLSRTCTAQRPYLLRTKSVLYSYRCIIALFTASAVSLKCRGLVVKYRFACPPVRLSASLHACWTRCVKQGLLRHTNRLPCFTSFLILDFSRSNCSMG